ncbi:MAG TPA: ATP phosphoribosyltransferase [Thermotogota bacterium]|nr:ATP phosphoribosyltransferase [Thermotogota bacterium]HRW91527.1 ATP phosphoribosyltransferase [Thermotogota bacterium]
MSIALPSGRILQEAAPFLFRAGIEVVQPEGRKLQSTSQDVDFIFCRAFDVPVYVEHGISLGIAGSDVVMERGSDVFIPLEFPFGKCRLSVIFPRGKQVELERMDGFRIATKYPRVTRQFFEARELEVRTVKLSGAVELAPLAGISDAIVDIVDSGRTLQENGLVESHLLMDVSAMLLVNRVAQKKFYGRINELVERLKKPGETGEDERGNAL